MKFLIEVLVLDDDKNWNYLGKGFLFGEKS